MQTEIIEKKIAFIGAGNMAEALTRGLLASKISRPELVSVADISSERLSHFQKQYGVNSEKSNLKAVQKADVVLLTVKPQILPEVLQAIKGDLEQSKLFISVAAGITLRYLEENLNSQARLIRAMPNLPALIGAGATVFSCGKKADQEDVALAKLFFESVGIVLEMKEEHLNAVTALSGSGPAYVFYLAEAMASAGVSLGLDPDAARQLATATVEGAGRMLKNTGVPAENLRSQVTSKGGTTEAALNCLRDFNFRETIFKALAAASSRAEELAR